MTRKTKERNWFEWQDYFRLAAKDIGEQYLEIWKARKKLFAWDSSGIGHSYELMVDRQIRSKKLVRENTNSEECSEDESEEEVEEASYGNFNAGTNE